MLSKITNQLQRKKPLKLMTHVVAGYPDMATTVQTVKLMEQCGVDIIEIQLPFTDPIADGPTILKACQKSLDKGTTVNHCFDLLDALQDVHIPLLFMTYFNIPYRFGIEKFINLAAKKKLCGLIVPDIPFDEPEGSFFKKTVAAGLAPVMVVSPTTAKKRLETITRHGRGFIYTTLKTGITGASASISREGLDFINYLKKKSSLPIAAGFGISTTEHLQLLKGKIDMAIIGSKLINDFNKGGLSAVAAFLKSCRRVCEAR